MLTHAGHHDQRDVEHQEGQVRMGVGVMEPLAKWSSGYAKVRGKAKAHSVHDGSPETNQDHVDSNVGSLAKKPDLPASGSRLKKRTVRSVQPSDRREFTGGSPLPHRRCRRSACGGAVHKLTR